MYDIILKGDDVEEMKDLKNLLVKEFENKRLETLRYFLGWKCQGLIKEYLFHK